MLFTRAFFMRWFGRTARRFFQMRHVFVHLFALREPVRATLRRHSATRVQYSAYNFSVLIRAFWRHLVFACVRCLVVYDLFFLVAFHRRRRFGRSFPNVGDNHILGFGCLRLFQGGLLCFVQHDFTTAEHVRLCGWNTAAFVKARKLLRDNVDARDVVDHLFSTVPPLFEAAFKIVPESHSLFSCVCVYCGRILFLQ